MVKPLALAAAVGAVLLAHPVGSALAQPATGLYLGTGAGVNLHETATSQSGNTRIGTDPGPVGVLGLGWGFGNGLRAEVEGSYRSNDLASLETRRVSGALVAHPGARGRVASHAVMANLFYDFDLGGFGLSLRPYVGAGIGYGWLRHDNVTADATFLVSLPGNSMVLPGRVTSNGTGGAFTYQAIGGVAVPLRSVPGLGVTAEYRYFAMDDAEIRGERAVFGAVGGVPPVTCGTGYFDNRNHSILIGLRYAFN